VRGGAGNGRVHGFSSDFGVLIEYRPKASPSTGRNARGGSSIFEDSPMSDQARAAHIRFRGGDLRSAAALAYALEDVAQVLVFEVRKLGGIATPDHVWNRHSNSARPGRRCRPPQKKCSAPVAAMRTCRRPGCRGLDVLARPTPDIESTHSRSRFIAIPATSGLQPFSSNHSGPEHVGDGI